MAKFVAASDFRNPDVEKIDVGADKIHDLHVHKGARFEIGGGLPFEKMTAADKRLVSELNAAGRIVYDEQKELVARIDAEVEADKKKEVELRKPRGKKEVTE
jgi:hypothetical protein